MNELQNYDQFYNFLTTLTTYDTDNLPIFCHQGFFDRKGVDSATNYHFNTLEESKEVFDSLVDINEQGFCCSIAINEITTYRNSKGDLTGYRRKGSISRIRAQVVDIDKPIPLSVIKEIRDVLEPHLIVITSPGEEDSYKCHVYWLYDQMSDEFSMKLIKNYNTIQKALAYRIDEFIAEYTEEQKNYTDKNVGCEKVLRCPGFFHQKKQPFLVNLAYANPDDPITEDGFDDWCDYVGLVGEHFEKAKQKQKDRIFNFDTEDASISRYVGAEDGERHSSMIQYATDLFCKYNFWYDAALGACLHANSQNEPELYEKEVEKIVDDCYNYWKNSLTPKALDKIKKGDGISALQIFYDKAAETAELLRKGDFLPDNEEHQEIQKKFSYDYTDKLKFIDVISDKSIMYRLLQRHEGFVLGSKYTGTRVYNPDNGCFEDDAGQVDSLINAIVSDLPSEDVVRDQFSKVVPDKDSGMEKVVLDIGKLRKYISDLRSSSKTAGLVGMIPRMKEFQIRPDDFDNHSNLINCPNGVIDLETGKLIEHDAKYKMSKVLKVEYKSQSYKQYMALDSNKDWLWSPKGGIGNGKGNIWTNFVFEIMDGDLEMCRFLQTVLGYAMEGHLLAQVLFFFYGLGHNGKSLFLETALNVFGTYGKPVTNAMYTENPVAHKNELVELSERAQLVGARFALSSEIEKNQYLKESSIKDLTTGSFISAKFYRENTFEYKPQFTSMLQGNYHPIVRGNDTGIWRRIVTVPCTVDFTDRMDAMLGTKLTHEFVAIDILRWMVAGNQIYRSEGLIMPDKVHQAKCTYKDEMHPIDKFVRDCLIPGKEDDEKITINEVYECYKVWCDDNNVEYLNRLTFGKELKRMHIEQCRDATNRYYKVVFNPTWYEIMNDPEAKKERTKSKIIDITGGKRLSGGKLV
jgi:P4 family phage/plasmid primase-like protien